MESEVLNLTKFICKVALFLVVPLMVFPQEPQTKNYQVYYPENDSPTAVCMVIHGLNLKPSRMVWIRDELLKQGAIVVNVELWGHGNNPVVVSDSAKLEERLSMLKQVSWTQWMNDTKPALDFINDICEEKELPKYFVGFSLGGLVGSSISMEFDFAFDKYFLLAPSIKIRSGPKVSVEIMSWFTNKVIRSRTPVRYRDNRGTPIAAYKALLKGAKKFKNVQPDLNNCLIIVDKNDELVSPKKLQKFAEEKNYSFVLLDKSKTECEYCSIHHLIIDEESLGSYSSLVAEEIQSMFAD